MAILGIAGAAVSTRMVLGPAPNPAARIAGELRVMLIEARAQAIRANVETVVRFDAGTARFLSARRELLLPNSIAATITGADVERTELSAIAIRFFPNGRSSGGEVRLRSASGEVRLVSVSWISGAATVSNEARP